MGRAASPRLPPRIATALSTILGPAVQQVRIVPHSLYARLHGKADATTRRDVIYLRGSLEAFLADPALLLHEYYHVIHQWQTRRLNKRRYVLEWIRNGYWNNAFEREAREFTRAHLEQLSAMLSPPLRPGHSDAPLRVAEQAEPVQPSLRSG